MPNDTLYSEKELLVLVGKSDEFAFAKLLTHYRDRIYSIAFKLTKSIVISEEIVHLFPFFLFTEANLFEIKNFNAYIFVVTRNDVYKALRVIAQNYKVVLLSDEQHLVTDIDTSDLLMEKEYNLLLQHAIDGLPSQQKEVYSLVKDQGFKRFEVAHQLHIQPETVKFHLAQAMKNIRAFCMLHLGSFIGCTIFLF